MTAGELPTEPEMHLDSRGERNDDPWEQPKSTTKKGKGKLDAKIKAKAPAEPEHDDFFAADDDGEEE